MKHTDRNGKAAGRVVWTERLEPRRLLHGVGSGEWEAVGAMVPWLTLPITTAPASPPPHVGGTPPPTSPPVSPPVSPPPTAAVGAIAGLTLIDAAADASLGAFTGGAALDLEAGSYSVRADTTGTVGSVVFLLDGQPIRTESTAPFSVAGDADGDYAAWAVPAGGHTLRAVPYAGAAAAGEAGAA
ncbi:MAG: hypothetical protein JWO31_541, partial [Phycisphaerales bacterium]|nr:hypothetical protein [Phycisphaerales bacterium]